MGVQTRQGSRQLGGRFASPQIWFTSRAAWQALRSFSGRCVHLNDDPAMVPRLVWVKIASYSPAQVFALQCDGNKEVRALEEPAQWRSRCFWQLEKSVGPEVFSVGVWGCEIHLNSALSANVILPSTLHIYGPSGLGVMRQSLQAISVQLNEKWPFLFLCESPNCLQRRQLW